MFGTSVRTSRVPLSSVEKEDSLEATEKLDAIFQRLSICGYKKAMDIENYTTFDRILGGISWAIQHLIPREQALEYRIQWNILYQRHETLKERLLFAQECTQRLNQLQDIKSFQISLIEPHELLLQEFSDFNRVAHIIDILCKAIDEKYQYQDKQKTWNTSKVKNFDSLLTQMNELFPVQRQYQCPGIDIEDEEDMKIQKCLLEYGERISCSSDGLKESPHSLEGGSFLQQLQAGIAAHQDRALESNTYTKNEMYDPLDKQLHQYQKQANLAEEQLIAKQVKREKMLLQDRIIAPALELSGHAEPQNKTISNDLERKQLIKQWKDLEQEKQKYEEIQVEMNQKYEELKASLTIPDIENVYRSLQEAIIRNDELKQNNEAFRAACRKERERMQQRLKRLEHFTSTVAHSTSGIDSKTLELEEVLKNTSSKYIEIRQKLAQQSRELLKYQVAVDSIPTRLEIVQYETRLSELYDQIALTLGETRKYFSVYNTLKQTNEFLEKEISILNSMYTNFDIGMSSKAATESFFQQLETIITNVRQSVEKQKVAKDRQEAQVTSLEAKYQILTEKERLYVRALREFQKECEKNQLLLQQVHNLHNT